MNRPSSAPFHHILLLMSWKRIHYFTQLLQIDFGLTNELLYFTMICLYFSWCGAQFTVASDRGADRVYVYCVRDSPYTKSAAAESLQSCPTLCDSIDGSPPGSAVPGILQARTLEWVAIFFSNAWKWKVKVKSLSHARLLVTPGTAAYQAPPSMGFSRQEYWSGCQCLLHILNLEVSYSPLPDLVSLWQNFQTGGCSLGFSSCLWASMSARCHHHHHVSTRMPCWLFRLNVPKTEFFTFYLNMPVLVTGAWPSF